MGKGGYSGGSGAGSSRPGGSGGPGLVESSVLQLQQVWPPEVGLPYTSADEVPWLQLDRPQAVAMWTATARGRCVRPLVLLIRHLWCTFAIDSTFFTIAQPLHQPYFVGNNKLVCQSVSKYKRDCGASSLSTSYGTFLERVTKHVIC